MSESIILDSVTKSTRKSNRIKKANVYEVISNKGQEKFHLVCLTVKIFGCLVSG